MQLRSSVAMAVVQDSAAALIQPLAWECPYVTGTSQLPGAAPPNRLSAPSPATPLRTRGACLPSPGSPPGSPRLERPNVRPPLFPPCAATVVWGGELEGAGKRVGGG